MSRCVAIDWSGRERGAEEFIWIAEAHDGELTFLENGRSGAEVVDWLIASRPPVVGLDFAFSFPAWFCEEHGWTSGPAVWRAIADGLGETLLDDEAPPFWGRTHRRPPADPARPQMRATDAGLGSKSVFQIGGAGAVGTGSIRGMTHLARLSAADFRVWPFDPPGRTPVVVEIYPRRLYGEGPIVKRRWRSRHDALARWFPRHPASQLLERAAGSEDAFDAAVSALAMSAHAGPLAAPDPADDPFRLEGRVWTPPTPQAPAVPEP